MITLENRVVLSDHIAVGTRDIGVNYPCICSIYTQLYVCRIVAPSLDMCVKNQYPITALANAGKDVVRLLGSSPSYNAILAIVIGT